MVGKIAMLTLALGLLAPLFPYGGLVSLVLIVASILLWREHERGQHAGESVSAWIDRMFPDSASIRSARRK